MTKKYAVIFDLDGTLIHSTPTIKAVVNKVMQEFDCPPLSETNINSFIGNGPMVLMQKVVNFHTTNDCKINIEIEALTDKFTAEYNLDAYTGTSLYPNIIEMLEQFKNKQIPMAVCTNKVHFATLEILRHFKIMDYFDFVIGGDQVAKRKPDPEGLLKAVERLEAEAFVFVGDSEVDAAAANNANLPFFFYEEGYLNAPISEIKFIAKFNNFNRLMGLIDSSYEV